jgi:Flp pilus assembly protein TadG
MAAAVFRFLVRSLRRDRRGATAVEFALILPVLMVALAGLADYGLMVYDSDELENAARTGAQYALSSSAAANDDTGIQSAALAALRDGSGVTVTISRNWLCPDGSAGSSGTACSSGYQPGRYVTVRLDRDFVPMFGLVLHNPTPLSSDATLRIE